MITKHHLPKHKKRALRDRCSLYCSSLTQTNGHFDGRLGMVIYATAKGIEQ